MQIFSKLNFSVFDLFYFGIFSSIEKIENDPIKIPAPPSNIAKIRKFFCLFIIFSGTLIVNYVI